MHHWKPTTLLLTAWLTAMALPALGAPAATASKGAGTTSTKTVAERASCSSLAQCKQPADKALKAIAELGFKWVDLSALSWSPHVSVKALLEDFDREAGRLEAILKETGLKISNFTFDAVESRPYEQYEREFTALAKFAARTKARLINLMAPSPKADRDDQVAKLRKLVAIAKKHDVLLTVETHVGQITEKPEEALRLCRDVPGLGLTLDPSHYYAGVHQGKSFDQLYPYVQGTGLRAGGMSWEQIHLPWGEGKVDFAKIIRDLEKAGYQGFYAAEYIEGFNQVDALVQSRRFLEWIRQYDQGGKP
ncbi:MAG: hypothetical protein AMXMBFR13_05550 [Phycisphaerae bacterium]